MMELVALGGRRYLQFASLRNEAHLRHALSTRPADVSARGDGQASARAARRASMAGDLGLDADRLHHCVQVHRTQIVAIDEDGPARSLDDTDGVVTMIPGLPVMTFSADCPLVLAYDPVLRVVGLAHASWRCTVARITALLVETMQREYGCRPGTLRAGIGPGAGPCCYEVREDVYAAAAVLDEHEQLFARRDGRMFFDLWEANRRQLVAAGVQPTRIEVAGLCTMCRGELLYSFRREGAGCGHFGLMAGIAAGRA